MGTVITHHRIRIQEEVHIATVINLRAIQHRPLIRTFINDIQVKTALQFHILILFEDGILREITQDLQTSLIDQTVDRFLLVIQHIRVRLRLTAGNGHDRRTQYP